MRFKEIANKRGFLIRDCYFTELSKHEICDIRLSMVEELQERLVGCKTDVPRLYELIAIPKSEYNYLKSWNNTFYFDRSRKYDDISCIFGTQKFGRFSLDEYLHVFPIMVKAWINGYVFPERFWDELKITTKQMIKNSKTNSKRELYNKLDSFFWGERDKQSVERFTELSAEILRILSKLKFVEL
jgi:hypothetical protein